MISKSQIKLINALSQKKYRNKHGLFVAEGIKVIKELLQSRFELEMLFAEADIFYTETHQIQLVSASDLKKISKLTTPQTALAVFKIPKSIQPIQDGFTLALDGVRDPGNLGTIIRLCDWFGIARLVCSQDTVDCYNPKVVQASMGSIARIAIDYVDLTDFLSTAAAPIYGTFMDGENVYQQPALAKNGILVMGNEGKGISAEVEKQVSHRLAIPQFGQQASTESLNVATATAVFLSEFRRGNQ